VDGHYRPCSIGSNCTVMGICEVSTNGLVSLRKAKALRAGVE
jgi:hypothetical protein